METNESAANKAFWAKVDVRGENECWPFTGYIKETGYGFHCSDGRQHRAHVVAYELTYGPKPEGTVLDHTCHNEDTECQGGFSCKHRRCMNPNHIEAVTGAENTLRGKSFAAVNARKTHCHMGHPLFGDNMFINSIGRRACRTCRLAYYLAAQVERKLARETVGAAA